MTQPIFPPEPAETPLNAPALYINREISLLQFNQRVLEEALDQRLPLLERVRFLAIFSTNLDEFFMIRVSGLKEQIAAGVIERTTDGLTPTEQLAAVRAAVLPLVQLQRDCFHNDLLPRLAGEGIDILDYRALSDHQQARLKTYFDDEIFPVLTPLAFDPAHPFPHISNLSLNLAVVIDDPEHGERFARIKVPASLPRLVAVESERPGALCFTWLEQIIDANLAALFPGIAVLNAYLFRIIRNTDMDVSEDEADDLLESIELGVRQRRFGPVVKLSTDLTMPPRLVELLIDQLDAAAEDVYVSEGPLDLSAIIALTRLERHELKHPPFLPSLPAVLSTGEDMFNIIQRRDVLVHHPYDSFTPVVDFLNAAARDPHVLAIKQTLYRVGRNSPVVQALLKAREYDKQVAVLVELKARFDEENNIEWARALEREGVHVAYGLVGLKTHCKIALVVRKERDGLRRYVHLGTGNYNAVTAHVYTDLGLFTANPDIGADASDLFNYLTGYSRQASYRKLLVAPITLRAHLAEMIEREIRHQQAGRRGRLIFKMNSLVDEQMIQLLYQASQAGVEIDLLVRGICCLRPGLPGISENIRVASVVGRFLEHSRIYYARNGGDDQMFAGSADLMQRNLDRRVEVLFPVEDQGVLALIRDEILGAGCRDTAQARVLQPNGLYACALPAPDEPLFSSQQYSLQRYSA
ncbi:MAG TPA: polyphosphate kinase 1 [Herpetosiphonaceae bacterium]